MDAPHASTLPAVRGLYPVHLVRLASVVKRVAGEIADYRPQQNELFGLPDGRPLVDGGLGRWPRGGGRVVGGIFIEELEPLPKHTSVGRRYIAKVAISDKQEKKQETQQML